MHGKGLRACLREQMRYTPALAYNCSPRVLLQLLLIGDSGVGKSCLLLRFAVSGGRLLYIAAAEGWQPPDVSC
jgi:hypothetical protein